MAEFWLCDWQGKHADDKLNVQNERLFLFTLLRDVNMAPGLFLFLEPQAIIPHNQNPKPGL